MSDNPWRYFMHEDLGDITVRRVRREQYADIFTKSGDTGIGETLEWHLDFPRAFKEITEDEAIKILGGLPWDEVKS